jgi:hypothetical protein
VRTISRLSRLGLICLAALAAVGARPARLSMEEAAGPAVDARYVVVGQVTHEASPPAQFRLLVTAVNTTDGPRPGQTIDIRFLNDQSVIPEAGTTVQVWLLGEKDGLYLVCPGTTCRLIPMPVADTYADRPAPAEDRTLLRWVVIAAVAAVAAYLVLASTRPARRRTPVAEAESPAASRRPVP